MCWIYLKKYILNNFFFQKNSILPNNSTKQFTWPSPFLKYIMEASDYLRSCNCLGHVHFFSVGALSLRALELVESDCFDEEMWCSTHIMSVNHITLL